MIAEALGWLGTIGTFVAYLAVSRGHLHAESWRYGSLNVIGGVLGGTGAVLYGAWPSAASNVIWAIVGGVTVVSGLQAAQRTAAVPDEGAAGSAATARRSARCAGS